MRVVALYGDDDYLMQEETARFTEVLEESFGGIERFRYDGREAELSDVLDELRSFGLIQQHKLVILDHADSFLSRSDDIRPAMLRYIENPVDDATLVLRFETFRSNGKLEKLLLDGQVVRACETITPAKATDWCIKRCKKRCDATIEPDAATLLVERLGTGMGRLDSELRKLASYVGPGGTIDRATVAGMVGASREEEVWGLQAAVLTGRAGVAVSKLRELLHISRQPEELVRWALADLARKLHTTRRIIDDGSSPRQAVFAARVFGESQNAIAQAAQAGQSESFAQLLRECIEADARVKSGQADSARSLEVMAIRMADMIGCGSSRR